ncbi:MAG: hypothetical protein KatS3mg008_0930 [Acidimicrobiales bacterium]|nr:MAG: hypothetical protein KatS3mg008_0930 [Acidimicrobiales bacterium]
MDTEAFRKTVLDLYGGTFEVDHPLDRRFKPLVDDIEGKSRENVLALLNHAVSLMEPGEAYLEVGSYKGLSLTAAMYGNEGRRFYAVESFREFGVDPDESRRQLFDNLRRWVTTENVTLLEGDSFRLLWEPGLVDEPVGVYFYDGIHGGVAQYLALAVAEPLLADEALVVIDDGSWPVVRRATSKYVSRHPGWELLFDIRAKRNYEPGWWNGLLVYRYTRPQAGRSPHPGWDARWRRQWYLKVYEPTMWMAAQTLPRVPWLQRVLKRMFSKEMRSAELPPVS